MHSTKCHRVSVSDCSGTMDADVDGMEINMTGIELNSALHWLHLVAVVAHDIGVNHTLLKKKILP